jgi:hypothetical protein
LAENWSERMQGSFPGPTKYLLDRLFIFPSDGKNRFRTQFKKITCFVDAPNATSGGINEAGCDITPADGPLFHAAIYHDDLAGWRKDIEEGARDSVYFLRE